MHPELFYQTNTEDTILLVMLTPEDYHKMKEHTQCMLVQQFKGALGEICIIQDETSGFKKVYIGKGQGTDTQALAHAVLRLPPGSYSVSEPISHTAALTWSLAQYKFNRYKAFETLPRILAIREEDYAAILNEAHAIFLVRDLINTPSNDMGPAEMADIVAALAYEHHGDFEQWIGDELLDDNFPAIHAVGRASSKPPRLLSLTWGKVSHPKVTLIGKGVCFDSGGLDLKTSPHMRLMKKDMGGAAQAIGLAKLLILRKTPIRLQLLIPALENAIGSNAYRPGDVLTMRNGLTVEIDNTDAEGRLVVADALVKACEDKPELIIDFTTLTGAARVAVGTEISALFCNHDQLAQALIESGDLLSDPICRLPLYAGYEKMLDSNIADLCNSPSTSYAGAITAALFLQRFVTPGINWAHFDIMAWNLNNKPGKPEGGEAMGLRAVADYLSGPFFKNV